MAKAVLEALVEEVADLVLEFISIITELIPILFNLKF